MKYSSRLNSRIAKLENVVHQGQRKVITCMKYEGETDEQALILAGYPVEEENRMVMFYCLVVSVDRETKKTTLTNRCDSNESLNRRYYNPEKVYPVKEAEFTL